MFCFQFWPKSTLIKQIQSSASIEERILFEYLIFFFISDFYNSLLSPLLRCSTNSYKEKYKKTCKLSGNSEPLLYRKGTIGYIEKIILEPLSNYMKFGVYSMEKLLFTLKRLYSSHLSKCLEFGVYSMEKLVRTLKD
jgi:hypothetical protein